MAKELSTIGLMFLLNTLLIIGLAFTIVNMEDSHNSQEIKCYDKYGSEIVGQTCLSNVDLFPLDSMLIMLVIVESFIITGFFIMVIVIIVKRIKERRDMKVLGKEDKL